MFETVVDIIAWPVQRRFALRGKIQKLLNDREEIVSDLGYILGYTTSFPRIQKHIAYMEEYWFLARMLR